MAENTKKLDLSKGMANELEKVKIPELTWRKLYYIKDTKAGFNAPFCAQNDLLAERMLSNDVNNPKAPIALNPEDFELWTAGSYCLETGEIKTDVKYLARALDYVKKNQTQPTEV